MNARKLVATLKFAVNLSQMACNTASKIFVTNWTSVWFQFHVNTSDVIFENESALQHLVANVAFDLIRLFVSDFDVVLQRAFVRETSFTELASIGLQLQMESRNVFVQSMFR
jgi:hypothetical protein